MKQRTKISAILMAIVLMITSISNHGMVTEAAVKVGNGRYTVTSEKKKTARLDRISAKNKTTLTIPATVKIGKKTYKVTEIKAGALKNNKKIKRLVIGKNVKKIGKQAFYGCKNLKKITIKTTKLTTKNVGKRAFAKLNNKVTVVVPASKLSDYQKLLKDKGVTGKNQVIKSSGTSDSTAPKTPTVVPNPEVRFAIGELESGVNDCWINTTTDASYDVGNSMWFTMWAKMPQEVYGSWSTKKKAVTRYLRCNICRKYFEIDTSDYAVHVGQTGHTGHTTFSNPNKPTIEMWYWTPDETPCKVVYQTVLPEGITANPNSIEVWRNVNEQISQADGNYTIQVSGQNVMVTINDIKQGIYRKYAKGAISPVVVKFSAKLEETVAEVNQVTANITYNCGGGNKTVDMNSVVVRKK